MSPHEPHGLPWSQLIIPQILNFTIFIGLLIYFIRQPLRQHFEGKSAEFEEQRKKSEEARVHAERENFELRSRLKKLEETTHQSLDEARKEAQLLKEKTLAEANVTAAKILEEAHRMVQFELQRAVTLLKQEMVVKATQMAGKNLAGEVDQKVQTRLNEEFVKKIDVGPS